MHRRFNHFVSIFIIAITLTAFAIGARAQLGIFEANGDVGSPSRAGSIVFDADKNTYTVTGGGSNMWLGSDSFQFVWKKVTNDVSLAADMAFSNSEGDAHRKACLMVRQNLEAGSVYADVALHGNGLIALQYRDAKGDITHGTNSPVKGPVRLSIEKRGSTISISIAGADGTLAPSGLSCSVALETPYYVGLAVCAHNDKMVRTATFSNVVLSTNK